jgi:hypothetical protein
VQAQRQALIHREEVRRHAEAIVHEMDQELNRLEDLYAAVTGGRSMPVLLSQMKRARQAGGGLFLAFDQGQYSRVEQEEEAARAVVAGVRKDLEAARSKPAARP